MAAIQTSGPAEGRQWTSSPRPKGRENAKNTLCRNVVIHGYCRNEKDGCPYNHDPTRNSSAVATTQVQSENMKKRLNVDSPAFTPGGPNSNGFSAVNKLSPKAVAAAPFTPKSSRSSLAPTHTLSRHQSTEWSSSDIREFVPQGYNTAPLVDQSASSSLADPFNPYSETSNYALEATPPSQLNPYTTDVLSTTAGPYYQQQANYTQPLQYHLYAPLGPHRENLQAYQRSVQEFFIPENLRQDLQRKADATLQVLPNSNLPAHIEHFHSLVPLDIVNQKGSTSFGYNTWLYKAVSSKDGLTYALRRIEGFRLTSEKSIRPVQSWKKLHNASITAVHDCFTTRAFGDSSLVFVTDYHPLSKTLAEQYLPTYTSSFHRSTRGALPANPPIAEGVFWCIAVQIASALEAIHSAGLAARIITPSKVIVTNKNRFRLNGIGVLDVVQYSDQRPNQLQLQQQEDFEQLGRLFLMLATQNPTATSGPGAAKALDAFIHVYSIRLRDTIVGLIERPPPSADKFIASIADLFASQLDNSLHADDILYSELNRELENGRLVRLLAKLGCVNERPEYGSGAGSANALPGNELHLHTHQHLNQQLLPHHTHGHQAAIPHGNSHSSITPSATSLNNTWSDTGERYFLKLFRDFVFHQVDANGRPVVDLGHIVTCLNKLDAGSEEKIALVSRDEQNVFVVSYKEVKRGLEGAFGDLVKMGRRG